MLINKFSCNVKNTWLALIVFHDASYQGIYDITEWIFLQSWGVVYIWKNAWYYPVFDSVEICTLINFKMNKSALLQVNNKELGRMYAIVGLSLQTIVCKK